MPRISIADILRAAALAGLLLGACERPVAPVGPSAPADVPTFQASERP